MDKKEILEKILQQTKNITLDKQMQDLLLGRKVNPLLSYQKPTLSQRIADGLAHIAGSWFFIISFSILLVGWIFINYRNPQAIDPYPFILLNLILSCLSALQAPLIMMSQNRQDQKDRLQIEQDAITNLKAEILVEQIYEHLIDIEKNQIEILEKINSF